MWTGGGIIHAAEVCLRSNKFNVLTDSQNLSSAFAADLPNFSIAFQPIVNVASGDIFAYEALARGVNDSLPSALFGSVSQERRALLDEACRICAIGLAADLGLAETRTSIALNFSPGCSELPPEFFDATVDVASSVGLSPTRIILEITDSQRVTPPQLRAITAAQYRHGFLTAVDDFGAGCDGLELLIRFQPDIVKLDMGLTRGINSDKEKQQSLQQILAICRTRGILVTAKGIETIEELNCLQRIGVTLCQGFLLCKPIFEELATCLGISPISAKHPVSPNLTSVRSGHNVVALPIRGESETEDAEVGEEEPSHQSTMSRLAEFGSVESSAGYEESWCNRFTPKELRILALLVGKSTCEEIAVQLDTPEKTVKNYLRAILSTTGSSDLPELAEFTVVHRLLKPAAKEF